MVCEKRCFVIVRVVVSMVGSITVTGVVVAYWWISSFGFVT